MTVLDEARKHLATYGAAHVECCGTPIVRKLVERVEWLESLFDFSDPEIVLHHAPNDPVTAGAVVVRQSHYEQKK